MRLKCWAYDDEEETICGQPAVTVDSRRGITVCELHRPDLQQQTALDWSRIAANWGDETPTGNFVDDDD